MQYRRLKAEMTQVAEHPVFNLKSVAVVVAARFHNPSILNPDFLVRQGIVPEDWKVGETVTTPAVSVVKYDNGVEWLVDQSRLTITESAGPGFGNNYRVHQIAEAYIRKLPYVPYRSLDLHFKVVMHEPDPQRRLIERFGAKWLENDSAVIWMRPKFKLEAADAQLYVDIADDSESGQIVSNCVVHHEGPLDTEQLCRAITQWPNRQEFVLSSITRLLGI